MSKKLFDDVINFPKKGVSSFFETLKYEEKIYNSEKRLPLYYNFKIIFEYILALTISTFSIPAILTLVLLIKIKKTGPVFHEQLRVGQYGHFFVVYKFRTLKKDAKHVTSIGLLPFTKIKKDPRIDGKLGEFLRKHKLDELPQLINVLKGEMSLIGPRPYTIEDNCHLKEEYIERFAVRPGMSGYWQALSKNLNDAEEKATLDCRYVREMSLALDLKIWINTFKVVLIGEDFSETESNKSKSSQKSKEPQRRVS